jgi:hypothetical protein
MDDHSASRELELANLEAERLILISMLTRCFPSLIRSHDPDESGVDTSFGWVIFIALPTGQVSFHVPEESRKSWFSHVGVARLPVWDKHDAEEKWHRVTEFIKMDPPKLKTKGVK